MHLFDKELAKCNTGHEDWQKLEKKKNKKKTYIMYLICNKRVMMAWIAHKFSAYTYIYICILSDPALCWVIFYFFYFLFFFFNLVIQIILKNI